MAIPSVSYSPNTSEPRFVVHKLSTVEYKPWSVIDTKTARNVERYHTKLSAHQLCNWCNEHGRQPTDHSDYLDFKSTIEALDKHMKQPEGDPLPKPPRHSIKRKIELDG